MGRGCLVGVNDPGPLSLALVILLSSESLLGDCFFQRCTDSLECTQAIFSRCRLGEDSAWAPFPNRFPGLPPRRSARKTMLKGNPQIFSVVNSVSIFDLPGAGSLAVPAIPDS